MRNAITIFSILKKVNLDLKSLELQPLRGKRASRLGA